MDRVPKAERSRVMSLIRSFGTSPERRLGELLRSLFPDEQIIERPALPGKPDFFLPRLGLALFADGCFWHGCPRHLRMPEDNRAYWEEKIRRNRARDKRANRELRATGVRPVRVWEHDLGKSLAAARRKIRRAEREAGKMPCGAKDSSCQREAWEDARAWFLVRGDPGSVYDRR